MSGKSFQEITLIGHLGKDPESRYTPAGKAVTTFSVAVDSEYTDSATNKKVETTAWFRVTTWDKQAENCSQYLKKGDCVFIKGHLTFDEKTGGPRIWAGNDNVARASFEVTASLVRFLSDKKDGQTASNTQQPPAAAYPAEDIPF